MIILDDFEHYFTQRFTAKNDTRRFEFSVKIRGVICDFVSAPGVFSAKEADLGSLLLANESDIPFNSRILDLGCGYGLVGVGVGKISGITVVMSEINRRASKLAKDNAKRNNITATVVSGDGFEKLNGELFDVILLNPPQAAGLKECFKLIDGSKKHLNIGGSLQVVGRHHRGGLAFERHMRELFGNVKTIGRKSGFRIYKSIKNNE